jgi:hypothetical protein
MTESLSALERIEIERACERLVHIYSRALDVGDLHAAADCFTEHGSLARPMKPEEIIQGREMIRASLLSRPKTLLTRHLATNIVIDVETRESARGISYLTMLATTPPGGAAPPFVSEGPLYVGEFRDRFVRERGAWRFLERRGSVYIKY